MLFINAPSDSGQWMAAHVSALPRIIIDLLILTLIHPVCLACLPMFYACCNLNQNDVCNYTSIGCLSGNSPARPHAVLSAFVCDGKINFIMEVWF